MGKGPETLTDLTLAAGASGGKTSSASWALRRGDAGPSAPLGRRSTAFFCRVRAARSPGGPKAQRASPAVLQTALLALSLQLFAASGECNELRRVAIRRVGWRRTARLKEPQKLGPKQAPTHHPNLSPMLSPKNSTTQSSPQFSAPCPPHCGSAFAPPVPLGTRKLGVSAPKRRPRQFLPDWPSANRQNMPF